METIMISIKPEWVEKIINGEKTIEVRKTMPKCELPFKCLIYETKNDGGSGKVVGEFICDKIDHIVMGCNGYIIENQDKAYTNDIAKQSCLTFNELEKYLGDKGGYAWHISNLKIYDEPKELWNYKKQNPCYYCKSERTDEGFELDYCWDACGNFDNGYCDGRCTEIQRPPQSWFYVEED